MGDFENTFGAGANVDSIIDGYTKSYLREEKTYSNQKPQPQTKQWFSSFQEANSWLKQNPGKVITRAPDGNGFIEK